MALKSWFGLNKRAAQRDKLNWEALKVAAATALQEKRYELAIELYSQIIEKEDGHADAEMLYKRANASNSLGRWTEALADYDGAIALDPTHARAYCNRGCVLEQLTRFEEALLSYGQAIALDPGDFLSYYNRGSALKELEQFDEALTSYDRAITLNDSYAPAFVNRGNVLHKLRQYESAIASYDRAIELDPDLAEAFQGRGVSLFILRRLNEALSCYEQALNIRSDYADAHSNRGCVFQEMGQHEAAIASFSKAIELKPDFAPAFQAIGFSLLRLQRFESAIESYEKARMIEPGRNYLLGMLLYARMQICDWSDLATGLGELTEGLRALRLVSAPFPVLALVDSPALHRLAAESWVENECPQDAAMCTMPALPRSAKIRVGYFSPDFCEHAVSLMIAEMFERHDRTRFEITAFAFGPRPEDAMRSRLRRTFDRFIDVRDESDADVARLARSLGIEIAVDLGGFTEYARPNIFALRAAPLQINYLGYPGTMGAEYIDYLIADRIVVPEEHKHHYAEKIIYMPNSYFPSDCTRPLAAARPNREELGLPIDGFVFCCFNNNYKMAPQVFAAWMRILSRTQNSVLWLSQNHPATARNLTREASNHGVDEKRLVFANRTSSRSDHLARLLAADLFLDTLPYNAHATANDALWAGLPIVTQRGESFPARVAASLLTAIGLPELVTTSIDEYEDLAVQLAADSQLCAGIKAKLLSNRSRASLFDTTSYAAHLEAAYVSIVERYRAGFAPEHVYVNS